MDLRDYERTVFIHGKNKGCTSWIALIVVFVFLFQLKQKKNLFTNFQEILMNQIISGEFDNKPKEITGVGDD